MITDFGKELRKLRIDRGDILKTMAEKLGMTSSYLSAIECGKRNIPDDLIEKLTEIYELTDEQQDALSVAYDNSLNVIPLDLLGVNGAKRDLALKFARKFNDLNDEEITAMLKTLRDKKGK